MVPTTVPRYKQANPFLPQILQVLHYDFATNTWAAVEKMERPRGGHAVVAADLVVTCVLKGKILSGSIAHVLRRV